MATKHRRFVLTDSDKPHLEKLFKSRPEQYKLLHQVYRDTPKIEYRVMAEMHGLPIGTVKSRISRAKDKIEQFRIDKAEEDHINISDIIRTDGGSNM